MNRRNFLTTAALIGGASLLGAQAQAKNEILADQQAFLPNTGPGNKFDYDGEALMFKGNSLVSQIPQNSDFYRHLLDFQNMLRHSDVGNQHIFLPKNSLHITLFNGTNDTPQDREKFWPKDMPKDATIEEVHRHYLQKLQNFKPDLPKKLTFKATELRWPFDKTGLTLDVELVNPDEQAKMVEFRRQLNELLQTSRNVPEEPKYHISLAYTWKTYPKALFERAAKERVIWSQEFAKTAPLLEIDQIEFSLFNDMLAFSPLYIFYLNK